MLYRVGPASLPVDRLEACPTGKRSALILERITLHTPHCSLFLESGNILY